MVESKADFYVAHRYKHEWPCDEEERELSALVAERIAALVAYDGIHHREAGAETAHQALDEHEAGNDACDGGRLDVNRERGLVTYAGLVFLLLEENHADDQVKNASADKVDFAFGNARVQKCPERDEKRKSCDNRRYDRNFYFVVENADDVHVQKTHEARNGVFGVHRESDRDVGKTAGDGDGRCDRLELRVLQVGAQGSEGGDHKDEQPVVCRKMKI